MHLWEKLKQLLGGEGAQDVSQETIPLKGYDKDISHLKNCFGEAPDFVTREFKLGLNGSRAAVLYLKSLADESSVASDIVLPLSCVPAIVEAPRLEHQPNQAKYVLAASNISETHDLQKVIDVLVIGHTALLIDGLNAVITIDTRAQLGRSTTTAEIETTILGPKVAFVEGCEANLSLIRQRVRTPKLRVESFVFGKINTSRAFVLYVEDQATQEIVQELRERLQSVSVDELKEINYLESIIGISPYSPFPQAIYTERPDRVSGNLLEGRIAILLDGSPEALILPAGFSDLFQSPADYYNHSAVAALMRTLRVVGFFLATTSPAIYVAIIAYNYEVLPIDLAFSVASARAGIPFPPIIEALSMVAIVDILQEGATRLPSKIGQTVGVVGGFVLGQAVIQARLVSPLLVIVVALSVIGSFATPDYKVAGLIRLMRYALLLAGGALSGVGIAAVWAATAIHMASIEVLGVPYLRPLAPLRIKSLSDFVIRKPYRSNAPEQAKRLGKEQKQ